MISDMLMRGLLDGGAIRFACVHATALANRGVRLHDCGPVGAHIFGRALAAGVLSAPLLGEDERYTFSWQYTGAVGNVVVEVGAAGDVRGFLTRPILHDQVESEEEIYGTDGTITAVRSSPTKLLSTSTVPAGLMDVVEDLAYLYSTSDQVESGMVVMIGFNPDPENPVKVCQGVFLQAMPGCDPQRFERFRRRLQSDECRRVLAQEPVGMDMCQRLARSVHPTDEPDDPNLELVECPTPAYRCRCSRERSRELLRTLGNEDLQAAVDQGETLRLTCQFCRREYAFAGDEIAAALAKQQESDA